MPAQDRPEVESQHQPGKTLGDIAHENVVTLLKKLRVGEVNRGLPHYVKRFTLVEYTLAIGGPGMSVNFVEDVDGEVLEGWLEYWETSGLARVQLPVTQAMELWEALQR